MTNQNLKEKLSYQIQRINDLQKTRQVLNEKNNDLNQEKKQLEAKRIRVELSLDCYKKVVSLIYDISIGKLQEQINMGLAYVFEDRDYSVEIVLEDKRDVKNVVIWFRDGSIDDDTLISIKNGIGYGARSVISFVVHSSYILNRGSYPIMFLDEAYTGISPDYADKFFSFIKHVLREAYIAMCLITQDIRFMDYGDESWRLMSGNISKID